MARPTALDDVSKRNRVLLALASGATMKEAADVAGVTKRTIDNYAKKHAWWADELEAAQLQGNQRSSADGAIDLVLRRTKPEPQPPAHAPPTEDEIDAAEMLGVDVDLIQHANGFLESPTTIRVHPIYGRLGTASFLNLCWDRACEATPQAPTWARILAPVMLNPTIQAQARRDEARARREDREEARAITGAEGNVEAGDAKPRGGGARVVVVPPNPARPWLGTPETVDAEVVE